MVRRVPPPSPGGAPLTSQRKPPSWRSLKRRDHKKYENEDKEKEKLIASQSLWVENLTGTSHPTETHPRWFRRGLGVVATGRGHPQGPPPGRWVGAPSTVPGGLGLPGGLPQLLLPPRCLVFSAADPRPPCRPAGLPFTAGLAGPLPDPATSLPASRCPGHLGTSQGRS